MVEEAEAQLVREIYAVASEEADWQGLVGKTATLLQSTGSFLFTPFLAPEDGGCAVFHNMAEPVVRQYLSEVATIDLWYQGLLRRHGTLKQGLVFSTDGLVDPATLQRSRFLADYLKPCEIGSCIGAMVGDGSRPDVPMTALTFYRTPGTGTFGAQEIAVLKRLQAHFAQAFSVRARLRPAFRDVAELALEHVTTAVVALGRDRRIVFANPAAEALLVGPGSKLAQQGRLCPSSSVEREVLDMALTACVAGRPGAAKRLLVRLSGPPGGGIVARLVPAPLKAQPLGPVAAIVFLMLEARSDVALCDRLRALYQLTASEALLVQALVDGETIETYAELRKVGAATLRTQLRSVFGKTGTRRQTDLMRLAFSLSR